jgi:serine/threonine-protein kinase PpkA
MGPYIEQCRELAGEIYDRVIAKGLENNVALGVVAFRSSVIARPKVEYTSKVVAPLLTATDRKAFDLALSQEKEAKASTHSFSEDSLAGLNTAIMDMDWEPYQGRIILLITDAAPLPIDDPFNSVPGDPAYIADKARRKNIKIVTLHLKTPDGKKSNDHELAEEAYKALSFQSDGGVAYLGIEAAASTSGTQNFAQSTESLVSGMDDILFGNQDSSVELPKSENLAASLGSVLGYSIKLDFLGDVNQTKAPSLVRAWIPDKDLANLDSSRPKRVPTTQVAVLLTKVQLSNLTTFLQAVLKSTEKALDTQSGDIFDEILMASSRFAVDPKLKINQDTRLADIGGMMGEMLSSLPYKSQIMSLTKQDWYNMGPIDQDRLIRRIAAILKSYDDYDRDTKNWVSFDHTNGEQLYRVPLDRLP